MRVTRQISDPAHLEQQWSVRWEGEDGGLITCWEAGRKMAMDDSVLADSAMKGVLVVLPWKGGVGRVIKAGKKYGSLFYLAMWQGLRGEPLDVDTDADVTLTCSRTGVAVTYTGDRSKYSQETGEPELDSV